jgi:hypothetical protein
MCQCRRERLYALSERELLSPEKPDLTDESNVVLCIALETWVVWETAECGDAREDRVGLHCGQSLLWKFHKGWKAPT